MSATDDEFGPGTPEPRPAPEPGEQQLRKALSTMNELEPPRDDLFVERAVIRGRARTSRRRSTVLGAAAALLVVGGVGTAWVAGNATSSPTSSAGSAAEAARDASGGPGNGPVTPAAGGPTSVLGTGRATGQEVKPNVPAVRDASPWFGLLATPQTAAFDTVEQTLTSRWAQVFSGAYAADAGSHIVVAVTRHDPDLEALVAGAMPSPGDVRFVLARHTYAEKARVLQQLTAERDVWRAKGVDILNITMDGRADTVVVVADEHASPGLLAQRFGDLVRVLPPTAVPTGKLPGGTPLPTLQR